VKHDGGTIRSVMHLRSVSNLSGGRRRSGVLPLAAFLHRVAYLIDAATRLIRSCVSLVGAVTALVVAIGILYLIASALW
jgi:hypothetical protein